MPDSFIPQLLQAVVQCSPNARGCPRRPEAARVLRYGTVAWAAASSRADTGADTGTGDDVGKEISESLCRAAAIVTLQIRKRRFRNTRVGRAVTEFQHARPVLVDPTDAVQLKLSKFGYGNFGWESKERDALCWSRKAGVESALRRVIARGPAVDGTGGKACRSRTSRRRAARTRTCLGLRLRLGFCLRASGGHGGVRTVWAERQENHKKRGCREGDKENTGALHVGLL